MAYGTMLADTFQSSAAATPPVIRDGKSAEIGRFCRAWINFTTSATSRASFNITSTTVNGSGDTSITMTIAMSDSYYAATTAYNFAEAGGGGAGYNSSLQTYLASKTSSVCRVRSWYGTAGAANDTTDQNVIITR